MEENKINTKTTEKDSNWVGISAFNCQNCGDDCHIENDAKKTHRDIIKTCCPYKVGCFANWHKAPFYD